MTQNKINITSLQDKYQNKAQKLSQEFYYRGVISASKSLMNRALICASYATTRSSSSPLKLEGDSQCDDVLEMKKAFSRLNMDSIFDCGAAGTVLRFLSLRASRIPGQHILRGTSRLMSRPQKDLIEVLHLLGVDVDLFSDRMIITSRGWQNLDSPIKVRGDTSSQFASGLILNAWNLEKDLILEMEGSLVSEGYFEMTLQVVKSLGMKLEKSNSCLIVPAHSQIQSHSYEVESDLSSAFAIAAFASLNGEAHFEKFPDPSLQPDADFVKILKTMGVLVEKNDRCLSIKKAPSLKGVEWNLNSCPDLFPVLASLCAFAETPSKLYGAPQLVHKESNRIQKVSELLNFLNVNHIVRPDGMEIFPKPLELSLRKANLLELQNKNTNQEKNKNSTFFQYSTDHDHRLAFAAALINSQGFPMNILNPEVVTKSFPEFWDIIS